MASTTRACTHARTHAHAHKRTTLDTHARQAPQDTAHRASRNIHRQLQSMLNCKLARDGQNLPHRRPRQTASAGVCSGASAAATLQNLVLADTVRSDRRCLKMSASAAAVSYLWHVPRVWMWILQCYNILKHDTVWCSTGISMNRYTYIALVFTVPPPHPGLSAASNGAK